MKSQFPQGWTSRNGNPEPIRPGVSWATLQTMARGPAYLLGYGVVDRDPRLISRNWVPWELANDTARWTLHTSIDASTFDPGALPAGWATAFIGGGTCTVAGGEILLTAPPTGTASLTYTIAGLGATDYVAIVLNYRYVTSNNMGNQSLRLGDSRQNNYIFNYLSSAGGGATLFNNAAASRAALTESSLLWSYGTTSLFSSCIRFLSDPQWRGFGCNNTIWAGVAATNYVELKADSSGGGVGNGVLASTHVAIYTGQE